MEPRKKRESGVVHFQSQEAINRRNREERRLKREAVLRRVDQLMNGKEDQRKNSPE